MCAVLHVYFYMMVVGWFDGYLVKAPCSMLPLVIDDLLFTFLLFLCLSSLLNILPQSLT